MESSRCSLVRSDLDRMAQRYMEGRRTNTYSTSLLGGSFITDWTVARLTALNSPRHSHSSRRTAAELVSPALPSRSQINHFEASCSQMNHFEATCSQIDAESAVRSHVPFRNTCSQINHFEASCSQINPFEATCSQIDAESAVRSHMPFRSIVLSNRCRIALSKPRS